MEFVYNTKVVLIINSFANITTSDKQLIKYLNIIIIIDIIIGFDKKNLNVYSVYKY